MTKLEVAFAEAAKLPQAEQESLAGWILEEISSQTRWDDLLARSPDALSRLADEALAEHHAGRTLPLDPDNL